MILLLFFYLFYYEFVLGKSLLNFKNVNYFYLNDVNYFID